MVLSENSKWHCTFNHFSHVFNKLKGTELFPWAIELFLWTIIDTFPKLNVYFWCKFLSWISWVTENATVFRNSCWNMNFYEPWISLQVGGSSFLLSTDLMIGILCPRKKCLLVQCYPPFQGVLRPIKPPALGRDITNLRCTCLLQLLILQMPSFCLGAPIMKLGIGGNIDHWARNN